MLHISSNFKVTGSKSNSLSFMQHYSNAHCACCFSLLFLITTKQPQKVLQNMQKMSLQELWGLHCIKISKHREIFSYLITPVHTKQSFVWNTAIIIKPLLYHDIKKKPDTTNQLLRFRKEEQNFIARYCRRCLPNI